MYRYRSRLVCCTSLEDRIVVIGFLVLVYKHGYFLFDLRVYLQRHIGASLSIGGYPGRRLQIKWIGDNYASRLPLRVDVVVRKGEKKDERRWKKNRIASQCMVIPCVKR